MNDQNENVPGPIPTTRLFGAELRAARQRVGLSLAALGDRFRDEGRIVHRGYLTNVETGDRFPTDRRFAEIADLLLDTDGLLTRLWDFTDVERAAQHEQAQQTRRLAARLAADTLAPVISGDIVLVPYPVAPDTVAYMRMSRRAFLATGGIAAVGGPAGQRGSSLPVPETDDRFGFNTFAARSWPDLTLTRSTPDAGTDWTALLPGGRSMQGARTGLQVHSAALDGSRVLLQADDPVRTHRLLSRPDRSLLIGAVDEADEPRYFVLDSRSVQRRGGHRDESVKVAFPAAYELDDLTYAILWAASNYDDALQADDQVLHGARADLTTYEQLRTSAVSREAAPDLNPVGHMWLGSDFCARHILRALPSLPSTPGFWTREQRGEEASAWLFFDHKYPYLKATTDTLGVSTTRTFCIPEPVVRDSPRHERILMFLAAALMESLGIRTQVTDDPTYETVEGFVLAPGQEAIIANWVRGEGIWHVDVTARKSVVRDLTSVVGDVSDRLVAPADTLVARLRDLAAYLDLPWTWMVTRCADLSAHGTTGIIRPRSRMLSMAGLDATCAYVGSLPIAS